MFGVLTDDVKVLSSWHLKINSQDGLVTHCDSIKIIKSFNFTQTRLMSATSLQQDCAGRQPNATC